MTAGRGVSGGPPGCAGFCELVAPGSGHDKGGQGASAFRAFLRALPDDVARAREDGLPVVLCVDRPLSVHSARLMDTLGVEVVVAVINQDVRVEPGADGGIVVMAAWCSVCKQESMPNFNGCCSWCGTKILDDETLPAREMLDQLRTSDSAASPEELKPEPKRGAPSKWTRELIVEALQRWAGEHDGVAPSQSDWQKRGEWWPSFSTAARFFDGWSAAIAAAGLQPRKSGARTTSPEREPQEASAGTAPAASSEVEGPSPPSRSEDAEPAEAPPVLTINGAALGVVRALRVFFETVERGLSD